MPRKVFISIKQRVRAKNRESKSIKLDQDFVKGLFEH